MKMVLMLGSVGRMCLLACLLFSWQQRVCSRRTGSQQGDKAPWPVQTLWPPSTRSSLSPSASRVTMRRSSSLTPPGAEPHDLELTPRQVASLTTASLVIYQIGFQPAVDEAVVQSGAEEIIDTCNVVPLQPLPTTEDDHDHDHGPNGPGEHGTRPACLAGSNLCRSNRSDGSGTAVDAGSRSRGRLRTQRRALDEELDSLDRSFRKGLARCVRTEFITTHAAFGYLATRYDLTQIAISGLVPDAEPSPARIAAVQDEAT